MKARIEKAVQRRLIRDLLTYRMGLVIIVLTTLVQVALTVYFPVLIGQAVDSLLSPNRLALLVPILLKMLVTMLANAVMQWLSPLLSNRLVYTYTSDLRNKINHHLNHLPIASIDRFGVGDLVSRITTDLEQLSNGLLMVFNQFFLGIVMIIVTLVTMSSLDIIMVTLVLVLTPLSLVLSRFIAQKSYLYFQEQTQSRGQQTQFIEEAINQGTVVHLFNAQDQMQERFRDLNHRYAQHSQKAVFYSSTVNPATRFVNSLIYALLAGIGAFRIIQGGFTVGQLVTFLNYVNQYTKPFNDISSVMSELQSALACAERLYHLLDLPLEEASPSLVSLDDLSGHVTFEEVSFGYIPDKPLIQNLNLNIPAGSQVAIVGPTGAGKSTLINLLMRFYDSDSGRIYIDQTPIDDVDRQVLRQQMGMVLQETWLKSASVHDNIAYGKPDASREEVVLAAKAANAHFFIEQLPEGYNTFLEDGGASLSQGQRQLLTIARAILKSPKILILDEATSSIDTRTESLIQDAFNTLMTGRTSFIIAHRLSTIRNADMILVMVDGDIVEHGNHEQLMSQKGFYYKMQRQED
ncbi:ABC transporter ATP-binding protein [Streptococcus hyovaginalis]|uniref:ABC transporter ATP-binding protein n=1 Tax=Streptococcus hyovaginalis TaxID=149015 RepID=UPI002A7C5307|nr:ABC transporter ATP-binding protein [Streptococcus hyovaginalis]MDY3024272.1 ABC transporter ATP-binding protein [Streptococcus hyovaginalis]MDY4511597.1 ABC transporter ATP-binding protein [Streptococcus hyovaginalis]